MAMKKKGYRMGGKMNKMGGRMMKYGGKTAKGMKNGGKAASKKKSMTVAQLRAAAKKMGYKITKT
mgnify:FL=1